MQRLSSHAGTVFFNRLFPACWYGLCLLVSLLLVQHALSTNHPGALLGLGGTGFMALVFYVATRADDVFESQMAEVWLDGDRLRIVNKHGEQWVPLANVAKAQLRTAGRSGPCVTLQLRPNGARWGKYIGFIPVGEGGYFSPFEPATVVEEVLQRIEALSREMPT